MASVFVAAATTGNVALIGPLMEAVLLARPVRVLEWEVSKQTLAWALPVAVVALSTVRALAQWVHAVSMQWVAQRVSTDLRRELYARLLGMPPAFFDSRHSGDVVSRFTADMAQVELSVAQALNSLLKDFLSVLGPLAYCVYLDSRLSFFAFIVLPLGILPVNRFGKAVKKAARGTQQQLGRLTERTSESLHNLAVIQAFGAEATLERQFALEQNAYVKGMKRSLALRGAVTPVVEWMGIVGVALALAFGTQAVIQEPALAGKLISFLGAVLWMYRPGKSLSQTVSFGLVGLSAVERVFDITHSTTERQGGWQVQPLSQRLSIRKLSVRYPEASFSALEEVSLELSRGTKIALVGTSGAGKSTLFSALLGFVPFAQGEIEWDGQPLSQADLKSLRAQLAWVPQEAVLFAGSVRQNLKVGRPNASEPELWEALRRAHAEQFVRQLPRGLDEEVGERGLKLSGGQRQRLAIARAFLRKPSLLLLDEPTSALDSASEREVALGLEQLLENATALIIAHRLSTVRDADQLFVLENGRVVEHGTHAVLMTQSRRYQALIHALEAEHQAA